MAIGIMLLTYFRNKEREKDHYVEKERNLFIYGFSMLQQYSNFFVNNKKRCLFKINSQDENEQDFLDRQ